MTIYKINPVPEIKFVMNILTNPSLNKKTKDSLIENRCNDNLFYKDLIVNFAEYRIDRMNENF